MLKSMTGFAKNEFSTKTAKYVLEIQSVNRRFLDISLILPKELFSLDRDIRREVEGKIFRGYVTLRLRRACKEGEDKELFLKLKRLKREFTSLEKRLGLEESSVDLRFLLDYESSLEEDVSGVEEKEILKWIKKAVGDLVDMRKKEAKALAFDIKGRLKKIEELLSKIKKIAPDSIDRYSKKLKKRFLDYGEDERILKEIFFLSEKVDITEEIVRLGSHIDQFRTFLNQEKIGRKMDFMLQEMIKETNTISSKSVEAKISSYVVDIKEELERIKEQVQNVE